MWSVDRSEAPKALQISDQAQDDVLIVGVRGLETSSKKTPRLFVHWQKGTVGAFA